MPDQETLERARRDKDEGKSPSTQAGDFVREEFHHAREGKHGVRSPKQAIAIGLSKARRAGVDLKPPKGGRGSSKIPEQAKRDLPKGRSGNRKTSPRRSRATSRALKRESTATASRSALSRQARNASKRRGHSSLHNAAMSAVRTKGRVGLRRTDRKAARRPRNR